MSTLSDAINNITGAATDLRETAAALKRIAEALETGLIPAAQRTLAAADPAPVTAKAIALIGRGGALVDKLTTIAEQLRDGSWIELDDVNFGGDIHLAGRIRLVGAQKGHTDAEVAPCRTDGDRRAQRPPRAERPAGVPRAG